MPTDILEGSATALTPAPTATTTGFRHTTLAQRVSFGTGQAVADLEHEVDQVAAQRILLISGSSQRSVAARLTARLTVVAHIDEVVQHVPAERAESARAVAWSSRADLVVAIGGGSAVGLAKAVALRTGLPIIAVPTTYAGSEATEVWGLTEHARKRTGVDPRVLPEAVVYDSELVRSLPREVSLASGLNALAHGVDALWGPRTEPINQGQALEGIRVLARALRDISSEPDTPGAHHRAQMGAYLCAVAFASAGSGMHHRICHVLGGAYGLPHAPMHAALLPHVLAYNAVAVPELADRIGLALGDPHADGPGDAPGDGSGGVRALERLTTEFGTPRSLAEVGLRLEDLREAAELSHDAIPRTNPRAVTREAVQALLTAAWHGTPASVPRLLRWRSP